MMVAKRLAIFVVVGYFAPLSQPINAQEREMVIPVPQFQKMAKEIFKKNFPAMTFIEVSHLARPQSVMEVQPIAVLP